MIKLLQITIPSASGIVRVKNATVQKSELTVDDIKDGIILHNSIFAFTLQKIGSLLAVYELHFNEATFLVGTDDNVKVTL